MEFVYEDDRRDGYFFDAGSFRLDLYRLITCFYSSVAFARYGEDIDHDPIRNLQGEYEGNEIVRLLVNISVQARIMDDRDALLSSRFLLHCGLLVPNLDNPQKDIPLTLREACNKVIHAKKFNWDVEQLKDEGNLPYPTTQYLTPRIYLYGLHGKSKWKATLDISKFVKYNASLWSG